MQDTYQTITTSAPFLTIVVKGIDLTTLTTTGDGLTKLVVSRVGDLTISYTIPLLEVVGKKLSFAMTNDFLVGVLPGRCEYLLYYKGNYLGSQQFIFSKDTPELIGL